MKSLGFFACRPLQASRTTGQIRAGTALPARWLAAVPFRGSRLAPWMCALPLAVSPAHDAFAGRPMATEDAGVLAAGLCEGESYGTQLSEEGVERAVTTQLVCAQGGSRQFGLSVSGVRTAEADRHALLGLSGKQSWMLGQRVPVALSINLNTLHETHRRLSWHSFAVTAVASPALGENTTLHLNLGWLRERIDGASGYSATWNLALEQALSARWAVSAEVFEMGRESIWRAVGLRWSASPHLDLNASWGMQAGTDASLLTAGLRYGF